MPFEVEGDREVRAGVRAGHDGDVDDSPDGPVDATDAPPVRRIEVDELGGGGPVGEADAPRRDAVVTDLRVAGAVHPAADDALLPLLEPTRVSGIGKDLDGREVDRDTRRDRLHSALAGDEVRVASQVERPALVLPDAIAKRLPARSVAIKMAVLELQTRPLRCLGDEADLDLTGAGFVRLELPVRADVPAEHDPVRWFVGEDAGPSALAPIRGAVVDVAPDPGLEPGLGDLGAEEVVLRWLEVAEPFDERGEGTIDRHVDDDLATDDRIIGQAHGFSCGGCSARSW